jgi:hypothetical protein
MWLYPLPALASLALWLYIFFTGPGGGIVFSTGFLLSAWLAFAVFERGRRA